MEVGIALVAGIAIGWVIEWVIDWLFWRRGVAGFYATETALRGQIADLQAEISAASTDIVQSQNDLSAARAQLHASQTKEAELERKLNEATIASAALEHPADKMISIDEDPTVTMGIVDKLVRINGIDAVYEEMLIAAGVATYAELAIVDVERLAEIIQPAAWQRIDFEIWIAQAKDIVAADNNSSTNDLTNEAES